MSGLLNYIRIPFDLGVNFPTEFTEYYFVYRREEYYGTRDARLIVLKNEYPVTVLRRET